MRFMDSLDVNWIGKDFLSNALRRILKKAFYASFDDSGPFKRLTLTFCDILIVNFYLKK